MKTVFRLPQWETLKDVLYFIRNNVGSKGWVVIDDKIDSDGYLVLRNASSEIYVKFWEKPDYFIFCDVGDGWDGTNILNKKSIHNNDEGGYDRPYIKKYDSYLVVDENFIFVGWYADVQGELSVWTHMLCFIYLTKFSSFNNDVCWIINTTTCGFFYGWRTYINYVDFGGCAQIEDYNRGIVINDISYTDLNNIKSNEFYYSNGGNNTYIRYDKCRQANDYSFTNILLKPLLFLYKVDLYNNGTLYTYPVCFLPFYITSLKKEQRFPHIVSYQNRNYFLTTVNDLNSDKADFAIAFEVDNTSF